MFNSEQYFVINTLRWLINRNNSAITFPEYNINQLDWSEVINFSQKQDVLGFVSFAVLSQDERSKLLPKVRAVLESSLKHCWFANAQKAYQFGKVHSLLNKAGIPFIPLKGILLTQDIYNDMPYRVMGDIDIQVSPKYAGQLHELLINNGFTKSPQKFLKNRWQGEILADLQKRGKIFSQKTNRFHYFNEQKVNIDVHYEPVYNIGGDGFTLFTNFFDKGTTIDLLFGKNIKKLTHQRHLLFLLLHALNEESIRLIQLLDIVLLIRRVPNAASVLQEEASFLPKSAQTKIIEFYEMVSGFFMLNQVAIDIRNLETQVKKKMERSGQRDIVKEHMSQMTWQEKLKYKVGYFLPNPKAYSGMNVMLMYWQHWKSLLNKIGWLLLRKIKALRTR